MIEKLNPFPSLSKDALNWEIQKIRQDGSLTGEQKGEQLNRIYQVLNRQFPAKGRANVFDLRQGRERQNEKAK